MINFMPLELHGVFRILNLTVYCNSMMAILTGAADVGVMKSNICHMQTCKHIKTHGIFNEINQNCHVVQFHTPVDSNHSIHGVPSFRSNITSTEAIAAPLTASVEFELKYRKYYYIHRMCIISIEVD